MSWNIVESKCFAHLNWDIWEMVRYRSEDNPTSTGNSRTLVQRATPRALITDTHHLYTE